MKIRKFIPLAGTCILMLMGCSKDNPQRFAGKQRVCFQFDYMNYAWGYQHNGWLIDSSGNVYSYDKPENWTFPDSAGRIRQQDMNRNLDAAELVYVIPDMNMLNAKISLIPAAGEGSLQGPVYEMCDAGIAGYYGFLFNPETGIYRKVLLRQTGDARIENSAPESAELYDWLVSLQALLSGTD